MPQHQSHMSHLGYDAYAASHTLQVEKLLKEGKTPDQVTTQIHAEYLQKGGTSWPGFDACINLLSPVFSDDTSVKKHPKFR